MPKNEGNKKKLILGIDLFIMWLLAVLLVGIIAYIDFNYFYPSASAAVLFIGYTGYLRVKSRKNVISILRKGAKILSPFERQNLSKYPLPVMLANKSGQIIWYNELFENEVVGGTQVMFQPVKKVFSELDFDSGATHFVADTSYSNKEYTVFGSFFSKGDNETYAYYFVDDTKQKEISREYTRTRPCVMVILVDNYEEMMENQRESEKARVSAAVEDVMEEFISYTSGFLYRLRRDRYMAIIEERHIKKIIEDKFPVLDRIRNSVSSQRMALTLSIGVGRGADTFKECEQMARQALDMALGRGGDQAAIKTDSGFEFYGGVSKGVEKRTKVKTRIVASALMELIENSSNVLVMGHSFGDLDCVGSAIGMSTAARRLGKRSYVVVNEKTNLSKLLIDRVRQKPEYQDLFISPQNSMDHVDKNTLLIIVDVHNKQILESVELFDACSNVAIIDHHRKMVNHIENSVMFFHEPYASSASEMVTELIQYFGNESVIARSEAEALLAGIMLDTKNFVIKTGVRTFEAAAHLRRCGADTVEVRKLFANSLMAYQLRTKLVSSAQVYRNCALAVSDLKVVASQAADELLTISGVEASFVVFLTGDVINISARSMGDMNVQIIMEKMGGGGHHTMAGAQVSGSDPEQVMHKLLAEIDNYLGPQK